MRPATYPTYLLVLALAACGACSEPGYRKATVVRMAMIFEPENLAEDTECRALWGNIARYGVEMDDGRKDWNEVILDSAAALIERGCVRRRLP